MKTSDFMEAHDVLFPYNCPRCGAHDYGLNAVLHGGCLHCSYPYRDTTTVTVGDNNPPVQDTVTMFSGVPKNNPVDHPAHYTSHPSGVECIQVTEHMSFNLGNAVKYIWRAGLKNDNAKEDLQKAIWYVKREIERLEGGTKV